MSNTLLKKEPCCKFLKNYNIKKYFQQFAKIRPLFSVKYNTQRQMFDCVWLELWKLLKIKGTSFLRCKW